MDIDLLERCRARDRGAFRGLVSLWGDQALRVALRAQPDRARAEAAVRDAFVKGWQALPSVHSENPFRPWLMRLVVRAATRDGVTADQQAAIILGSRSPEQADRAVRAILAEPSHVTLSQTFFDDELEPKLEDTHVLEVRRQIGADRRVVWATLADPRALSAWTATKDARVRPDGTLQAGARIAARGAIADRRRSRDESVVTRVEEPSLLAWTTRSKIAPWPAPIEFRWTIELVAREQGCEAQHRLLGVAFPPVSSAPLLERSYAKLEGSMQGSMHRGIERLASLVEQRAHHDAHE